MSEAKGNESREIAAGTKGGDGKPAEKDGDRMPAQAGEAINPSSPGDTGTTPGTNAENG